jgi:hypothetical protein
LLPSAARIFPDFVLLLPAAVCCCSAAAGYAARPLCRATCASTAVAPLCSSPKLGRLFFRAPPKGFVPFSSASVQLELELVRVFD